MKFTALGILIIHGRIASHCTDCYSELYKCVLYTPKTHHTATADSTSLYFTKQFLLCKIHTCFEDAKAWVSRLVNTENMYVFYMVISVEKTWLYSMMLQ